MSETNPKQDTISIILNELNKWKKGTELFANETFESQQQMVQQVLKDIDELKEKAQNFTVQQIQNGDWFNQFIKGMLANYAETIIQGGGIEFFRQKYPGLTRSQIAQKLCDLAIRYSAIAGGVSGTVSSAAFAATIGTAGGASVIAVPAGIAAIVAEMLYTTRLQIRLVYDLSIIYGYPINLDDPEDLYKVFSMAYGVTFVGGNMGTAVKTFSPEVTRAYIRGIINGHTPVIQQVAKRVLGPRIGRNITQRSILRAAVPGVSVVISAGWNYLSTQHIANAAKHELHALGKLRDAVRDVSEVLQTNQQDAPLVLECMLAVITADGKFDPHEQEIFNQVVQYLNVSVETLETLESRTDISLSSLEMRLKTITDSKLRQTLATCIELIAVSDGDIHRKEIPILQKLFGAMEYDLDIEKLKENAKVFKRPNNWVDDLSLSITGMAGQAGQFIGNVSESVSGIFGKGKKEQLTKEDQEAIKAQKVLDELDKESSKVEQQKLDEVRQISLSHARGEISNEEFATRIQALTNEM